MPFAAALTAWHRRSLAQSFALRAAALAVACVLLVAAISIAVIYWSERRGADTELHQKAANAARRLEEPMRVMESALAELSRSALFTTALLDSAARRVHVAPFLRNYAFPIPAANGLALCDINGHRLTGTAMLSNCNSDSVEFRAVLADGWTRRTLATDRDGRRLFTIYQGVQFVYTGTTEGVAVAQLVVDDLLQPLATDLDLQGVQLTVAGGIAADGADEAIPRAQAGGETAAVQLFNGEPLLDSGVLSLIAIGRPQPLANVMVPLLVAYFLATLTLVSIILFLARRGARDLTVPLVALRNAAREIARTGDLSLPIPRAGDDEVGQLAASLGTMVDAIRSADTTRREAEERFRLVFEKSNEAILFAFPDGRIEAANQSACALFGCTEDELVALGRNGVVDPTDPRAGAAVAERARMGTFRGELRFRRADGSVFEAEIASTLFDDSQGRRRSSTVLRDITQRRAAADRLRDSEARYRNLFDTSPGAILVVSNWQVLMVNPAAVALFGADEAIALERRPVLDCFARAHRPVLAPRLQRAIAHGVATPAIELEAQRLDGTTRTVESVLTPFTIGGERVVHFMLRDITERMAMQREITANAARVADMSRRLVAVQEEGRRRLAGELHDRTSPNLAAIGINLELIATALPVNIANALASRLEDTRALLDDTTTSIREISSDLRPPVLDHAGLAGALDSYADQFSQRTGIAIRVDGPGGVQRLPHETESALFRIAQEALTNVAKHAAATSVAVKLALDDDCIALTVTDDGIGFDPQARAGKAGLGIVNMREMAEFVGGRLSVRSSQGSGTTIHIEV